jgi:PKD repeat protein
VANRLYLLVCALICCAPMSIATAANGGLQLQINVTIDNRSKVILSADINPSNFGQTVIFTAAVNAVQGVGVPLPAGTVTFSIDGLPQTPVALIGGIATFSTSSLSVGTHTVNAHYSGDAEILSSDSAVLAALVIDPSPPVIQSQPSGDSATGTVGQPVTFNFPVTGPNNTFVWTWGDGTSATTTSPTATHTWTGPGQYTITVTATDQAGTSVSATITFTITAAATPPGGLCDGFPPGALTKLKASAHLKFPSSALKPADMLSVAATIQLPAGFSPAGMTLQWVIGGIPGQAVLNAVGTSKNSAATKAMIRFKKPKKGTTFKAGPGMLTISLRKVSLAALQLTGITTLNAAAKKKTGDPAGLVICVLYNNANAYTATASGVYKATIRTTKAGVTSGTGSFSGH